MRTDFRGELIQSNKKIGFGNFSDYQDRKEFFIEGHKPYEDELVRLALNESLTKKNMLSLEARICPKNTSAAPVSKPSAAHYPLHKNIPAIRFFGSPLRCCSV